MAVGTQCKYGDLFSLNKKKSIQLKITLLMVHMYAFCSYGLNQHLCAHGRTNQAPIFFVHEKMACPSCCLGWSRGDGVGIINSQFMVSSNCVQKGACIIGP